MSRRLTVAARAMEAADPATSIQRLCELVGDQSPSVRREAAANSSTPADAVAQLGSDQDWRTRAVVAARGGIPADVHLGLISDKVWQVRYALADNPHADPTVWVAMARTASSDTRTVFAGNRWLPEEIAQILADDPDSDVRRVVASVTPYRNILDRLVDDPDPGVRLYSLGNPLITAQQVIDASHDRVAFVREGVATHRLLPAADRRRLASADRSVHVRRAAAEAQAQIRSRIPDRMRPEDDELPALTDPLVLARWPSTARKPSSRWFAMFSQYRPGSDQIPDHVQRFWQLARRIDTDPAWQAWWRPAGIARLEVRIDAGPGAPHLVRRGDILYAFTSSQPLLERVEGTSTQTLHQPDPALIYQLMLDELHDLFGEIAGQLSLAPPPPIPKN